MNPRADLPPQAGAERLWPWLLLAAALVVFRTWPFAWWGTLAFDADQAVVGLMAKHIAEFRALPVYQYALPYVLMVTAYVTAPFMWVFGPTPFALKLPLVLLNTGVGVALTATVARAGVGAPVAFVLCLPVLMTSGVTTAGLMDALGMTVEPAAFVLAIWSLRSTPLSLGIVATVAFHVREFVAYAIAAVAALDVVGATWSTLAVLRHRWATTAIWATGTSGVIAATARFASVRGPDTWADAEAGSHLATLGGAFCFAWPQAARNVGDLATSYLGLLWGATPAPLSDVAVQSRVVQGLPWAWPVLATVLVIAAVRIASRWRLLWRRRHTSLVQFGTFLTLVGAQAVGVYALSRCGPLSLLTVRYALLGMFLPTGLALLLWAVEERPAVRHLVGVSFVALAALNALSHARLWREQLSHPAWSNRAQLGVALEARGIRYARSDYWTAYYVAFMTQERVIVGADTLSRVDIYERSLDSHADQIVRIATTPCGDGPAVVPGYYLCPAVVP